LLFQANKERNAYDSVNHKFQRSAYLPKLLLFMRLNAISGFFLTVLLFCAAASVSAHAQISKNVELTVRDAASAHCLDSSAVQRMAIRAKVLPYWYLYSYRARVFCIVRNLPLKNEPGFSTQAAVETKHVTIDQPGASQ